MSLTDTLREATSDVQKQADETKIQYDNLAVSLSPMVERILEEFGEALWGKRFFFRRFSFKSYKKYGHQTWVIIKRGAPVNSTFDCVSVMLSKDMKKFYLCSSNSLDHRNCNSMDSPGLTEQALRESLLKICKKRVIYSQD